MTIDKSMLAMMIYMLTVACDASDRQPPRVEGRGIAHLPRIHQSGKDYPYIRYPEVTGQTASRGRAFFLYPMKSARNELLALEYAPGMKIEDLFAEDLIGTGGVVVEMERQIRVAFLPISLPIGVRAGQEWRMQYARRRFVCRSRAAPEASGVAEKIAVSCTSETYRLAFTFSRERGVTEFQDFCDFHICTFRLSDSEGLLSKTMTDFMGLPHI
jgi:hypothetical protein